MIRRGLAISALVGALLLAPAAAHAESYGELTGPNSASVGSSQTFTYAPYTFPTATVSVDGPGTAVISPAALVTEVIPASGGELAFTVEFPVAGVYQITVVDGEQDVIADFEVTAVIPSADDELGETGFDGAALIWFGGGALILGGALVVTMAIVRRNAKLPAGV